MIESKRLTNWLDQILENYDENVLKIVDLGQNNKKKSGGFFGLFGGSGDKKSTN